MRLIVATYRKLDTYHFKRILNVTLTLWGVLLLLLCAVERFEIQVLSRAGIAISRHCGCLPDLAACLHSCLFV